MTSFLGFLASAAVGAAICTVAIALIARPLSALIHNLVYPPRKTPRVYTASVTR